MKLYRLIVDVNLLFGVFREIVYVTQRKIKVNILKSRIRIHSNYTVDVCSRIMPYFYKA